MGNFIHILTRAKKNVVAYGKPPKKKKHQKGRPREYGKKSKLITLFDSTAQCHTFQIIEADIYGQSENIRYLVLDLLWKPVKGMLRFILVETSRGRIILMTSDLKLGPVTAIQLYCRRVTIETMFDTLKNNLGAMAYHFWSQYLSRASRKPKKQKDQEQNSTNPMRTNNTLAAIEKFVNVQLLVLGMLQLIAKQFPKPKSILDTVASRHGLMTMFLFPIPLLLFICDWPSIARTPNIGKPLKAIQSTASRPA